jgi:CheY-like chemotaxis protein
MSYVLIVDDERDHREILADLLGEMGFATRQAADGRQALEIVDEELPLAVLLDLRMPVLSGWGLLDALKQMPRASAVPIIVISGYGYEWEAELIGATGYVSKPVDLQKLKETIHGAVGSPSPLQH